MCPGLLPPRHHLQTHQPRQPEHGTHMRRHGTSIPPHPRPHPHMKRCTSHAPPHAHPHMQCCTSHPPSAGLSSSLSEHRSRSEHNTMPAGVVWAGSPPESALPLAVVAAAAGGRCHESPERSSCSWPMPLPHRACAPDALGAVRAGEAGRQGRDGWQVAAGEPGREGWEVSGSSAALLKPPPSAAPRLPAAALQGRAGSAGSRAGAPWAGAARVPPPLRRPGPAAGWLSSSSSSSGGRGQGERSGRRLGLEENSRLASSSACCCCWGPCRNSARDTLPSMPKGSPAGGGGVRCCCCCCSTALQPSLLAAVAVVGEAGSRGVGASRLALGLAGCASWRLAGGRVPDPSCREGSSSSGKQHSSCC